MLEIFKAAGLGGGSAPVESNILPSFDHGVAYEYVPAGGELRIDFIHGIYEII